MIEHEPVALPFVIFVDGDPAPKGSVERNRTRGVRHTKRSKDWHDVQVDAIKRQIRRLAAADDRDGVVAHVGALHRDVAVDVEVVLRKPPTSTLDTPDAKRHGDLDKHLRSVLDALVAAGVLADDSLVVETHARKRWAGPTERCGVRIMLNRPTSELLREGAKVIARAFDATLDELGFVPMADPRGLLNVAGVSPVSTAIRSAADLTRIMPGDNNELSDDGGR